MGLYRLYSFSSAVFPDARSEFQADTPEAWDGLVARLGGGPAFDTLGTDRAPLLAPYSLVYRSVFAASSLGALEPSIATWRAFVGRRATLTKRLISAATYYDVAARLTQMRYQVEPAHGFGVWVPMEWRFLVLSEFWQAQASSFVSYTINATPKVCAVSNAGNAVIRDCVVRVTPDASNITALTIGITGVAEMTYSGTIPVGDYLEIDCGARTVRNGAGTDLYASFALTSNHKSEDWLPLLAGSTDVNVTKTGGSSSSTVTFTRYARYL